MEEVGLMEFRFQPDVFEHGHVSPVTDADADLLVGTSERFGRSGFTRRTVILRLCGKCGIVRCRLRQPTKSFVATAPDVISSPTCTRKLLSIRCDRIALAVRS